MLVTPEEIGSVEENIEKYNFNSFFDMAWQNKWFKSILKSENREIKHGIFWLLLDEKASFDLSKQLYV
jgi:hypothetical protein